ncbi:MAG: 4'-phosphopantetheinyl transferase superfamily protein [Myxococcales bacterium]|nr:4'-phosphopantetheinyl transferase superfamily protein [Myxococcales bacterium]
MIGNDVVDLLDPESRPETLHPRFDTRVFTAAERAALAAHEPARAARLRWKLWAAKEAAYKLARKRSAATVFSPTRFEIAAPEAAADASELVVTHEGTRHRVVFAETDGALHAVATDLRPARGAVLTGWRRLALGDLDAADPEAPGRAVRALVCEQVAPRLGVRADELEVRRRGRIPYLCLRGEPLDADLSLSHHGEWLGFACELAPGTAAGAAPAPAGGER